MISKYQDKVQTRIIDQFSGELNISQVDGGITSWRISTFTMHGKGKPLHAKSQNLLYKYLHKSQIIFKNIFLTRYLGRIYNYIIIFIIPKGEARQTGPPFFGATDTSEPIRPLIPQTLRTIPLVLRMSGHKPYWTLRSLRT